MWVRVTDDENERALKRESALTSAIRAGIAMLLYVLLLMLGWNRMTKALDPRPWSCLPVRILGALATSVVLYAWFYWTEIGRKRRIRSSAFVCLGCGNDVADRVPPSCPCGGPCVDLNHAKWVDDDAVKRGVEKGYASRTFSQDD